MKLPNVLVLGTGEYVTGFVNGAESSSDKGAGVVGLTLFDLRQRGLIGDLLFAGTNGEKFSAMRAHLEAWKTAMAEEKEVVIAMEVHKRWGSIYADARQRIRDLGDFSYFQSYMSQPKSPTGESCKAGVSGGVGFQWSGSRNGDRDGGFDHADG